VRALIGRWLPPATGLLIVAGVVLLAQAVLPPASRDRTRRELWLYQNLHLADSAAVAHAAPLWRRAAAAGYARIALVDERFARLATQDSAYFERLRTLRMLADSLRLEIVPGVALVGRGNGAMLAMDPNLAEALPVRDAAFEVRGGIARPLADPPVALAAHPDDVEPGAEVAGGVARLHGGRHARIAWTLTLAPWRSYHVSVRLRGVGFRGEPRIRVTGEGHGELAFASALAPAGDSTQTRDVVFNSQECRRATIGIALSQGARGTLECSGWRIEESGPVNLVRRSGMTFRIAGLQEGRDYEPVVDTLLGRHAGPGTFDAWHTPPLVHVRRPDGTRLRASWYAAGVVLRGQASCCLSDTSVSRRLREEIARVRELFGARTLFLMHDEIRVLGQDAPCVAHHGSAAQILAANLRECRADAGDARVCVWSDMFDPHHNAVDRYYLVRGSLASSWDGLGRDVTVVDWNQEDPAASLAFFAARGNRIIWAGYYDEPVESIRRILPLLDRTPRVTAIMYTTWRGRFEDLEAFAKLCRGR
jgi:hypothetical protein